MYVLHKIIFLKADTTASFKRGFVADFSTPSFPCYVVCTILGEDPRSKAVHASFSATKNWRGKIDREKSTIEFTSARKTRPGKKHSARKPRENEAHECGIQ